MRPRRVVGELLDRIRGRQRYVTRSGRVLHDEDIQELADEAERGYDIEHLKPKMTYTVGALIEKIAREFGAVVVSYVPENSSEDPDENMPWTVSMFEGRDIETYDPVTGKPTGKIVEDWHEHEHGAELYDTAKALYDQLRRERRTNGNTQR